MSYRALILGLVFSFATLLSGLAQTGLNVVVPESAATTVPSIIECVVPQAEFPETSLVRLAHTNGSGFILGQIGTPKLNSSAGRDQHILTFVLPPDLANGPTELTLQKDKSEAELFAWTDHESKYRELRIGTRPVLRYMYETMDRSTPERSEETYKAYHHLFDPRGSDLVTKGPGGLYPHHRGMFLGFNKISYGDKQADIWHCKDGEFQAHVKFIREDAGAVYGRHQVQIDWHGRDGAVFVSETREMTAFNVDGGNLVEFRTRLTTNLPHVRLDGDPQHAGFQFRASQFVPDHTAKLTYYLRPDGKDSPGNFRNWSNQPNETKINQQHVDLPWNAVSFVLAGDKRLTCCYLDHPENPKPARYSERDYGRFGSYFEYELTPDHPLNLQYRIWLQDGEMSVEQANFLSNDFNHPRQLKAVLK